MTQEELQRIFGSATVLFGQQQMPSSKKQLPKKRKDIKITEQKLNVTDVPTPVAVLPVGSRPVQTKIQEAQKTLSKETSLILINVALV